MFYSEIDTKKYVGVIFHKNDNTNEVILKKWVKSFKENDLQNILTKLLDLSTVCDDSVRSEVLALLVRLEKTIIDSLHQWSMQQVCYSDISFLFIIIIIL